MMVHSWIHSECWEVTGLSHRIGIWNQRTVARGLSHKHCINDGDLSGCLCPFVLTMPFAGQRKRKSLQVFVGSLICRGQFVAGWRWTSLLLVKLIFTFIHFVRVIYRYSGKCYGGGDTNLRAHLLPRDFSCWWTHAELKYLVQPTHFQFLWLESLTGMFAGSFKGEEKNREEKKR